MKMLNPQQKKEFEIHAERMVHWLRANGHPHMTVVVDSNRAELLEGMMATMPEWRDRGESPSVMSQGAIAGGSQLGAETARFNAAVRSAKLDLPPSAVEHNVEKHPLYSQYWLAIHQAMYGKGVRHGGAVTPFLDQPWIHYARMHGIGFLTGQAAKKLEEAASTKSGEAFVNEIRGAMVYLGMALIYHEELENKKCDAMQKNESRG